MERMMIKKNNPAPEYFKSRTAVWWDINRCPLPDGYDAFRVGPRIDTVLMSLGYSGPLTMTAIGDLECTPVKVLRALSSTGILLRDAPCGIMSVSLDILTWEKNNQPPATIMLISDYAGVASLSYSLGRLQTLGYNILMAYPHTLPQQLPGLVTCAEWLWEAFLTDSMDSENKQKTRPKDSTEFMFICKSCRCCFASNSFQMFIRHLRCRGHEMNSLKPRVPIKVVYFKEDVGTIGSGEDYVPVYYDAARPRKVYPAEVECSLPKHDASSTSKVYPAAVECSLRKHAARSTSKLKNISNIR